MATNEEILAGMAQFVDQAADAGPEEVSGEGYVVEDLGVNSPDDRLPNLNTVNDALDYLDQNPS